MIPSKIYKLENSDKKKKEKFLIIVPIKNFIFKDIFIEPDMLIRNTYFSFPTIKNYFFERCGKKHLPFHFYVDFIKNDWNILTASPIDYKSFWLEECIRKYYIPSYFQDATIVCIQDSMDFQIPDSRMYKLIGKTLAEPYLGENKNQNINSGIFLFHEIFNYDKYYSDKEKYNLNLDYNFLLEEATFFDRVTFNLEVASML